MNLEEFLKEKIIKIHTAKQRQVFRASTFALSKIENESLDLEMISLKDLKEVCEEFHFEELFSLAEAIEKLQEKVK